MAKQNVRINIPANADDLIVLAKKILARAAEPNGPTPLPEEKMTDMTAKTATADTKNELCKDLARQAETATEARDNALGQTGQLRDGTVRFYVTSVRDVLLGLNKGNEHALGDWGFDVDASPSPSAKAKPSVKPT
jgi:hypothetical protein